MVVAPRVSTLICLAAGLVVCRPAAAAMTMVFRDGRGGKRTFYQDGSRVRIVNPTGKDDGEASIIDLTSNDHRVVYADVKAYFDVNKAAAARDGKGRTPPSRPRAARVSYRPLHESRTVNGYSCEMYERIVARRVDGEVCFALWGDAIGQAADFAWVNAVPATWAGSILGKTPQPAVARRVEGDKEPGLAIWKSWTADDGTEEVREILTISREPLKPALFEIPAGYKEVEGPLSASERARRAPSPAADTAEISAAHPARPRITSLVVIILVIALGIGLIVHSMILHLAANIVLDRPRFTQALIAAVIIWTVGVVAELFLPSVIEAPIMLFAAFAAVKISYGASIPRTLALFAVCAAIGLMAQLAGAAFFR